MAPDEETPEDRTARMLRRVPVEDIIAEHGSTPKLSEDYLYLKGYLLDEWLLARCNFISKRALKDINRVLHKALQAKMRKR